VPTPTRAPPPIGRRIKSATPVFACLPKTILKHPPVAHRNRPDDGLLSVFECAIAAAAVAVARGQIASVRHAFALGIGRAALREQRGQLGEGSKWLAQFKVGGGTNYEFALAGASGYLDGQQAFECAGRPKTISLEMTKSTLLRAAGLSRKGANHARLDAALSRLRSPVRAGRRELPPLLKGYRRLAGGKLRLLIDGAWLPHVIGRVPMPVPTSGANVLALFLFLCGTDQRSVSRPSIAAEKLCDLVGISWSRPGHAQRALDRALERVNRHLRSLDGGALARLELPVAFDLVPIGDGARVRCQAIYGAPSEAPVPDTTGAEIFDEIDRRRARAARGYAPDEEPTEAEIAQASWARQHERQRQQKDATRREMATLMAKLRGTSE
jgi:hypothetical protein